MIYGTVLCLGDSLTYGARASWGYPEMLPSMLNAGTYTKWATLNRGISAETTRDILLRTPGAVRELESLPGAKWCVILAGTNDAKTNGIDVNAWREMYKAIWHWPWRYNIPTILCTLPPIDFVEMPYFTRDSQKWIDTANGLIRKWVPMMADSCPAKLCELDEMPTEYLIDGVHCTEEGYRFIAEQVAAVIKKDGE